MWSHSLKAGAVPGHVLDHAGQEDLFSNGLPLVGKKD